MSSKVSSSTFAIAFASKLKEKKENEVNYVDIFNSNNRHHGDLTQTYLRSKAYKDLDVKEKNEWKRAVLDELKKNGITINGEPSGTPSSDSASASAPAPAPAPAKKGLTPKGFVDALIANPVNCSYVDLTNQNHKNHTNESRDLLEKIKEMDKDEKRKFLLAVCAELSKKGVSVTLWNGNLFSPNHSSDSVSSSSNETKTSPKSSPKPSGSTKGKEKKKVDFVTLFTKLREAGLEENDAAKHAQAILNSIN
jgi:disulfide oxidoreductase YuzD